MTELAEQINASANDSEEQESEEEQGEEEQPETTTVRRGRSRSANA